MRVYLCVTKISINKEIMNPRGNGARKGGVGGQRKGVQEMMSIHCIHVRNVNERSISLFSYNSRLFARVLFNDGVALHRAAVVTDLLAQAVTQGGKP